MAGETQDLCFYRVPPYILTGSLSSGQSSPLRLIELACLLQRSGITGEPPSCLAFLWVLRLQTLVRILAGQALHSLSHFQPSFTFHFIDWLL